MLGLDRKALRKLRGLIASPDVPDDERVFLQTIFERYANPEWHFFTSKERKLIEEKYEQHLEPPSPGVLAAGRRMVVRMERILEEDGPSEYWKEKIRAVLGDSGGNIKMFPPWTRRVVKELENQAQLYQEQSGIRQRLERAVDAGEVRQGSEEFCRSIIEKFDQSKKWSAVQQEHAEKILAGNRDPGD